MKGFCVLFLLVLATSFSFSQDLIDYLKNSVERSEGGAGATVTYTVYINPTNARTYYAKDFDKGNVVFSEGEAAYFELSKKEGEEEEIVVINLKSIAYMELGVTIIKGKYKYQYKFYF